MSEEKYTLTKEQILHGLAEFVYNFDGYAEYAKDWADDGFSGFIRGTQTDEYYKNYYDEEDEDE